MHLSQITIGSWLIALLAIIYFHHKELSETFSRYYPNRTGYISLAFLISWMFAACVPFVLVAIYSLVYSQIYNAAILYMTFGPLLASSSCIFCVVLTMPIFRFVWKTKERLANLYKPD